MSCLNFGQNSFSSFTSSKKRKTKKADAPEPYFMDGNPTSLSTFELGCDSDSVRNEDWNDENDYFADDLSILAGSNQNSTLNFPTSAPSSIARNKILACSTPKDQVQAEQVSLTTEQSVMKPKVPVDQPKSTVYSATPFTGQCENRRMMYRTNRMRNMVAPSPGRENIKNCYYTKENRPILEELHRKENEERRARQQRAESRDRILTTVSEHCFEFVCSLLITIWQIHYLFNVIPYAEEHVSLFNIFFLSLYTILFMIPYPTWWGIMGCSLFVYFLFTWLIGINMVFSSFAFAAVFAKAATTVIQVLFLIFC
ncbi:hypothetical protein B9Z55_026231 [Caenorhabditis nigoni]|uniref:Uncharacterized protein n=1 Tax=Caenorhabditis nigoni TaxID=1611254 RepID=A0A2G5T2D7_9PELO|nr:hypothetical protein B9Z55_026231 [Caenorhabditis nigoni]